MPAANAAYVTEDQTFASGRRREPSAAHAVTATATAILATILATRADVLVASVQDEWSSLVFWAVVVCLVDLFPVSVGRLQLTLDMPLLLAVGLTYPPEAAAALALVAAIDVRELKRGVTFSNGLFNRVQIALSIWAASTVFHFFEPDLTVSYMSVLAASAALLADYTVNTFLVALRTGTSTGFRLRYVLGQLKIGAATEFLATYLGYGLLALVLAALFARMGAAPIILFLIPTLVARQLFTRSQELEKLSARQYEQERLLERALDRVVDERRDERLRISSQLHEDVLQALVRIHMIARGVVGGAREERHLREDLRDLVRISDGTLNSLRRVMAGLEESPLGGMGLPESLRSLVGDLQIDWRVPIWTDLPERVELNADVQIALYQIAREGLTNALKHSRSAQVGLTLEDKGGHLFLTVEDQGVGFKEQDIESSRHFGLGLVRERVRRIGGVMRIDSSQGKGTRLTVIIPTQQSPK